ncbi:MAG: 2-amino-4-hydroxy-6-hydroxymethyldihydropteridine diphosphokinase [Rikenella sp.]|nr:2-amino-4-hydroxy-6-hydroxymethyldihydropteridine diphosphokinase [Rikenella sp.]
MAVHRALLLLGSNLGDRAEALASARSRLAATAGRVVAVSRVYESEPWGVFAAGEEPSPFLNQAVGLETSLDPLALLDATQRIERELGRAEHGPEYDAVTGGRVYRPRTLDIDMLFYDSAILRLSRLTVPHPRLVERRFALEPAAELWPDYLHPERKIALKELFNSFLLGDSR